MLRVNYFLVDRLELETQAQKEIKRYFQMIYKQQYGKKKEMIGEKQILLSQPFNHLLKTTNTKEYLNLIVLI